jgi:hypothetical protein
VIKEQIYQEGPAEHVLHLAWPLGKDDTQIQEAFHIRNKNKKFLKRYNNSKCVCTQEQNFKTHKTKSDRDERSNRNDPLL